MILESLNGVKMHQIDDILISDNVWNTNFECDLDQCKGVCCKIGDIGSPLSQEEDSVINDNLDKLRDVLPRKNICFLKSGITEKFRGDLHIREMGKNHPCPLSFTSSKGIILCSLHNLAIEEKVPLLSLKPLWCSLFPLILKQTKAGWIINMFIPEFCRSKADSSPLLLSFSSELEQIFGKEWIQKLKNEYKKQTIENSGYS